MLQAIGLTSTPRRNRPPAVNDLTFEARPGQVTALLGPSGSGKTTALRLMLGLERGRGVTYFRGRPLHRVAHPIREVGALLGDLPGHPARTTRGQLRMLCAASGVPVVRADELLDAVGLAELRDQRLGALSLGMERRLGIAATLLGHPHTLVLDEPAAGLSSHEAAWLNSLLRAHADQGGTVLYTTDDPKAAARTADHVVALAAGRLVADQNAEAFAHSRLRPRVAVHTPHAARLAAHLSRESRASRRPVEIVTESGNRLYVYGGDCAEVGETAFRHGILLHRLTHETGASPTAEAPSTPEPTPQAEHEAAPPGSASAPEPQAGSATRAGAVGPGLVRHDDRHAPDPAPPGPGALADDPSASGAPPATARHPSPREASTRAAVRAEDRPNVRAMKPRRGPMWPLRYEARRILGVPSTPLVVGATLVVSVVMAVWLARAGGTPLHRVLVAWPELLPLPPAALGAGLIGAFSYGHEFRYPVLQTALGAVPRRLGLLLAKLAVTAAAALLLAVVVVVVDLEVLRLVYGGGLIPVPGNWPVLCSTWTGLLVGCGWAGLLAAGVFRAAAAGLAAVLAVPVVIAPLVERALEGPSARPIAGLPARLGALAWAHWPGEADHWLNGALHVLTQPVGAALALSLTALLCAFLATGLRRRIHV